jgi:hypothetical protein
VVHVGLSTFDQFAGKVVKLLEVVASKCNLERLISEPVNAIADVVDEFLVLLDGISVIVSEISKTAIFLGESKVESHSFSMTDVQISIRLWRESCHDFSTSGSLVLLQQLFGVSSSFDVSTDDVRE